MRVPTGRLRIVLTEPEKVSWTTSPGRYIHEQRVRLGLSIEELAARTKIPRRSLEALEADAHDELPGPVFVKGFLRCCARALSLEVDVVLELLLEQERREHELQRERERAQDGETLVALEQVDDLEITEERSSGVVTALNAASDDPPQERARERRAGVLEDMIAAARVAVASALARLPRSRALLWIAVTALLIVAVCSAYVVTATDGLQAASPQS